MISASLGQAAEEAAAAQKKKIEEDAKAREKLLADAAAAQTKADAANLASISASDSFAGLEHCVAGFSMDHMRAVFCLCLGQLP